MSLAGSRSGPPLATFQAVAQQVADVYVASRTLHLATVSACWRLDAGMDGPATLAWRGTGARKRRHGRCGPVITCTADGHGRDLPAAPLLGTGQRPGAIPRRGRVPTGAAGMFIELTERQAELRDELRGYFAGLLSPAERAELLTERHGASTATWSAGWAATDGSGWAGLPSTAGAASARSNSRSSRTRRPAPTSRCPPSPCRPSARCLQHHGTARQKELFLPRILAGEVHFAIGYTEPDAGTDLAALRTRAVRRRGLRGRRPEDIPARAPTRPTTSRLACRPARTDPGTRESPS